MIIKLLISLSVCFAWSCQPKDNDTALEQKEIAKISASRKDKLVGATNKWFAAFNSRDLKGIQDAYADSAILIDPDHLTPLKGSAEIVKTYAQLFEYVPDVKDSVVTIVVDDPNVAVEFVARGSSPDGPFKTRIMTMFQFDERGRIVRDATYYDRKQ